MQTRTSQVVTPVILSCCRASCTRTALYTPHADMTRRIISVGLVLLVASVSAVSSQQAAQPASQQTAQPLQQPQQLLRRAACPQHHDTFCPDASVCCPPDTTCTRDAAGQPACCPTGARCTGSLSSGAFLQSTVTATTATPATAATTATTPDSTLSVLTGTYPFTVIPTSFPNAAVCSVYYSMCTSQYAACTAALGGGGGGGAAYPVTVVIGGTTTVTDAGAAGGGGGGVTSALPASAAAATCSSLSVEACHGLQAAYCAVYATAVGPGSGAALVRRAGGGVSDVLFAAAVGAAGFFV